MFKQKALKVFAVALAVLVVLCTPLTASAATMSTTLSNKSEFGFQFTQSTVYTPQGESFLPKQMYINSYGNIDYITFTLPQNVKGDYYFAFSFKTLKDNYSGIEFDVEVSDRLYTGQEYDQYFNNISASNGSDSYNWFSGWVGTEHLQGKISDNEIVTEKGTPIVSKHYHIQAPPDGKKCNSYQFAFGLQFPMSGASEVTLAIKNFEFVIQQYDEKAEANKSGNDSIDGVTGALPKVDFSGLQNSLEVLTQNMMYNGTDCVWEFPALYIPKVENLIPNKIPLTSEKDIDIGAWVRKMPSPALMVIQAFCSIGIILFIIYELYSFIIFCMTLKSNQVGKDEECED